MSEIKIGCYTLTFQKTGYFFIGVSSDVDRLAKSIDSRLKQEKYFSKAIQELYVEDQAIDFQIQYFDTVELAELRKFEILRQQYKNELLLNTIIGSSITGAYILKHRPTGLFYIGSSSSLVRRRFEHLAQLRRGKHPVKRLQEACGDALDPDSIEWQHFVCWDREGAYKKEQELLDTYRSSPDLLNSSNDVKVFGLGLVKDQVSKDKIAEARRAYWEDPQQRSNAIDSFLKAWDGNTERKNVLANRLKQQWQDPVYREKMSGEANPNARAVVAAGVQYPTVKEALAALGIAHNTLLSRIKSDKPKWANYHYVD